MVYQAVSKVSPNNLSNKHLFGTERPSPSGDEDQLEGSLVRKHEWESTTKKASNR